MNYKHLKLIIIFIFIFFQFGIQILFAQTDSASQFPDLIPYRSGDKWGFCDKNKKIIIPLKYDEVFCFYKGLANVSLNGKLGLIDKEGKEIIPPIYESARRTHLGLIEIQLNGKWGFFNEEGVEIIPIIYQNKILKKEYILAELNGKWGGLDKEGKEIIPFIYNFSFYFGLKLNGKAGFINSEGKEIIPFKYKAVRYYGGIATVLLNEKWGCIDNEGKELIPFKYEYAFHFKEGLASVKLNGKWGYIDKEGKEIIPIKYENSLNFNEGLAPVMLNGKWGWIDKDGKEIIPFKYDSLLQFKNGLANVKLNGKWGCIDKNGKEIIPFKYEYAWDFRDGLAPVMLNGKWGYVNEKGREINPQKYEKAWSFSEGLAPVMLNGKWGWIDKDGKEIISIKYDSAHYFYKGLALVVLNGKRGYIDRNGTEYWEEGFSNIVNRTYEEAKKAFEEGKYLLVLELLKDFSIEDPFYSDAIKLMTLALEKIPTNDNQNFVTISGRIITKNNKKIDGLLIFEDMKTKTTISRCGISSDGYYCTVLPSGKIYSYYLNSEGYYPISHVIDFSSPTQSSNYKDNFTIVSFEEMKKEETSVRINNVFFDFNESRLKTESYLELDRLFEFLDENFEINIEISGHTDNIGSDEYNITLSNARANSVKDYLVSKGISANRIISKGYGKSQPVATNETDEGRQLNRRVEFKILRK